jgi:predicted phage terminase large subunit-like protein
MTRWSLRDLTAQVLKASAQRGGDEWEVIEFPAILPSGNPLWPEFWPLDLLLPLKQTLDNSKWMAQYQQQPTSDSAAVIKRDWWRVWEEDDPPDCEYILQVWDTAFEAKTRSDFSAGTTWGVFYHPDNSGTKQANIILLNAVKDRVEFPALKRMVLEQYDAYHPDGLIVEKKASGAPLIYELRSMGIPAQEYTPVRGSATNPNNKIARLSAVSDVIASGLVWAPRTPWAEELIDEVAAFPSGEHDDYVDTLIMALMRFRQGGFLRLPSDEQEEPRGFRRKREGYY